MGQIKNVEICKVGTWNKVPITLERMQNWVKVNNHIEFSSVIGHPSKNLKKIGKHVAGTMRIVGDRLVQDIQDIPDWFSQGVSDGFFPSRSVKFNPKTDEFYHTGWLPSGVDPAVEGLAPVMVQLSKLAEHADNLGDSQYLEFSIKNRRKMDEETKEMFEEFNKRLLASEADNQDLKAKNKALEVNLAKVIANQAEKPTEFSAFVDGLVKENKIFEWQKPFLNKLDPFKPIEFSSDSDRTELIDQLKNLSQSWAIPVEFGAYPKGKDMTKDEKDKEEKDQEEAFEEVRNRMTKAYKKDK